MDRRQFLKCATTGLSVGLAGCVSTSQNDETTGCTGEWTPTIDADEPTLTPGEETTLQIEITEITGMQLRLPLVDDNDPLEFPQGTSTFPSPDSSLDVAPPLWYWNSCTDVEIEAPTQVHQDAQPTTIDYTVHIIQARGGESMEQTYTITVSNDQ